MGHCLQCSQNYNYGWKQLSALKNPSREEPMIINFGKAEKAKIWSEFRKGQRERIWLAHLVHDMYSLFQINIIISVLHLDANTLLHLATSPPPKAMWFHLSDIITVGCVSMDFGLITSGVQLCLILVSLLYYHSESQHKKCTTNSQRHKKFLSEPTPNIKHVLNVSNGNFQVCFVWRPSFLTMHGDIK